MTYGAYRERLDDPKVSFPGYEAYGLSPLVKWPLLVQSDGNAVAPIAGDLLRRGPRGFEVDRTYPLPRPPD